MTKKHHILVSFCAMAGALAVCAVPAVAAEAGEACPNAQARAEQPYGLTLPDCRAYEMVSPLQKDDDGVSYITSRASVSGEAVTYFSRGVFSEPESALLEDRYLSRRGEHGWSTQNISPPYTDYRQKALSPPFEELLFEPDLSRGLLRSIYTPLVPGEPAGYVNLYVADLEDSSYQIVSNVTPEKEFKPFTETSDDTPEPEGVSSDLSCVVFQQAASLVEGASPGYEHVYEWAGSTLHLVDVAPEGEARLEGEDNVGSAATNDEPISFGNTWNAVSGDCSRVVFTDGEKGTISGQLYMRKNPANSVEDCQITEDACTVKVSASQRTDCNVQRKAKEPGYVCKSVLEPDPHGPQPAFYRDASVDGSRVFFTSRAELTNDANTGLADEAANLYEYDLETGVLSDLTVTSPEDLGGAAVLGVVAASEDGSYVYFVANGVLAAEAKGGNCRMAAGEAALVGGRTCSLYVLHRASGGWEPPRFLATLAGSNVERFSRGGEGDEADWIGYEPGNFDFGPGQHTARVTGDGTRLAFESELSLTGFDNGQAEPGECGVSGRCREVYVYSAETGKLVCVSCDPNFGEGTPTRPVGRASLGGHEEEAGTLSETTPFYLPRNFTDGGRRLFFQSPNALVPQDSNGKLDVYEWELPASPVEMAKGENSCTLSSSDFHTAVEGCVVPISDVAGDYESHFMDASESGTSVFIATADQLLPSDTDFREDVYDVRVNGGFPVSVPAPVCTNADSCKPPVSPQPAIFGAPASATFSGPGSPPLSSSPPPPQAVVVKAKLTKCKRGFAREKVKKKETCIKEKRKKQVKRTSRDRRPVR